MEREKMVNDESYEQLMLANAVEDFLTKLLKEYPEEYYVEISVGSDNPGEMIIPISKTFRGNKQ
ncbi:MAG: hypothetical protein KAQ84_05505 [Thermoplasmatales archaeon]|nr:hypothetical protein [Thermoplasmatales archaeon]MCK5261731.1 hypothetical protein [Thermoplasmatales archaeon]